MVHLFDLKHRFHVVFVEQELAVVFNFETISQNGPLKWMIG